MTTTATDRVSKPVKGQRPRWLTPVIMIALLVAAAMTVTMMNRSGRQNDDDLDPANPGYTGAQGLARSLGNHGVTVTIVRSQRELLGQRIDGATTVVITRPNQLSERTARTALTHAASAASLVLLDADREVTAGMGLPVESHRAQLTDVAAGCQSTEVGAGFRLGQADRAYTPKRISDGR
ncbi:MAG TPA: DUF4350 domain-containing protein, partial [Dermatophilaceae bacterium]|nr:DUF4350 domain-containing protein [Dermatophilaceae bacterium]